MKKCVVTGEETEMHSNGVPLSYKGKKLLEKIIESHNKKISDVFIEKIAGNTEENIDPESFRRFAPSIGRKAALQLLKAEEDDIMITRAEVLEE